MAAAAEHRGTPGHDRRGDSSTAPRELSTGEAIVLPDERATFSELAALTRVMARRLRAAGVEHGDRVGLLNTDRVESLAMLFGAMRIGAVPVPVNARYKARELSYVVAHAGMHLLLLDPQFAPLLEDADLPEHCRVVIGLDETAFVAGGETVDDDGARAARGRGAARRRGDHPLHVGDDRESRRAASTTRRGWRRRRSTTRERSS